MKKKHSMSGVELLVLIAIFIPILIYITYLESGHDENVPLFLKLHAKNYKMLKQAIGTMILLVYAGSIVI